MYTLSCATSLSSFYNLLRNVMRKQISKIFLYLSGAVHVSRSPQNCICRSAYKYFSLAASPFIDILLCVVAYSFKIRLQQQLKNLLAGLTKYG